MKKASILRILLIGGTFLLVTSVIGSSLFEAPYWETLIVGLVFITIFGAIFAFEDDGNKD